MSAATVSPPLEAFEEYQVICPLGAGAMGQVFLARDRLLERLVAIKFIAAPSPSTSARARFFAEARALARLMHPNVVAVHRVGEARGQPFIVSEYVHGKSLDKLERPVPWRRALEIGVDLSRGLAAAHKSGVLHRDIKPANAVLTDEGAVKLLDFGLAELAPAPAPDDPPALPPAPSPRREAEAAATTSFRAGAESGVAARSATVPADGDDGASRRLAGTPLYMAPELFLGEAATAQSDVYALGVLLFELVTGHVPHPAEDVGALIDAVTSRPAPPLAQAAPDVDPDFAAVVDRCLDRSLRARLPSAEALCAALERVVAEPEEAAALPEGNPYPGLLPFEAPSRHLFFGRAADVRAVLDRVLAQPFVLVAGDSGAGKSSLCRAGILPAFVELGGKRTTVSLLGPGRRPVEAIAAALAPLLDARDDDAVAAALRTAPATLGLALRRRYEGEVLFFIDQIEELCTLAPPEEAIAASKALGALVDTAGTLRILAAGRGDSIGRLAMLPGLGDALDGALYLLRPLSLEGLRMAIAGPARARGVSFESSALVETLAKEARRAPGGLAVLAVALRDLWEVHDKVTLTIRQAAFDAMDGFGGPLARHADAVLMALRPAEVEAARAIMLALARSGEVRVRESDLLAAQPRRRRSVLQALVRGRVLALGQGEQDRERVYTLAHQGLLHHSETLRGWRGAERRAQTSTDTLAREAVRERLAWAAAEWERLGRRDDMCWNAAQMKEAAWLRVDDLEPTEKDFWMASRRRRQRGFLLVAGVPSAVLVALSQVFTVPLNRYSGTQTMSKGYQTAPYVALSPQTYVAPSPQTYVPPSPQPQIPAIPHTYVAPSPQPYLPAIPQTYVPSSPQTYGPPSPHIYGPPIPQPDVPAIPQPPVVGFAPEPFVSPYGPRPVRQRSPFDHSYEPPVPRSYLPPGQPYSPSRPY